MSAVNITNVTVLDHPASFLGPFQFEISYECVTPLKDDAEWKLIYVESAEDETQIHQILLKFARKILSESPYSFLHALTWGTNLSEWVITSTNDFEDEQLKEEPPQKVQVDNVLRNILSDKPRVTKFPINFLPENSGSKEQPPALENQAEIEVDGEEPFHLPIEAGKVNAEKPEF